VSGLNILGDEWLRQRGDAETFDRRLLDQICGACEKATADPKLDPPARAVDLPLDLARVSGKQ
jgi:hypothetical protein